MAARLTRVPLDIAPPEQIKILFHQPQAGGYALLRLHAPQCAARARPGTVIRLTGDTLTHTAPLLRADERTGWVEILCSATVPLAAINLDALIRLDIAPGPTLSPPSRRCPLLIGDATGTPPVIFMADSMRQQKNLCPLILLGYNTAPPFIAVPSRILIQDMPSGIIAAMPLLEDWGIPSRIAHSQGQPGCFEGSVDELTRLWLNALSSAQRADTEIIVSGPGALTDTITTLAHQYQIPCQALPVALAQ